MRVAWRTQPQPSVLCSGSGAAPPLLWVRLGYLTALNALFSQIYRFIRTHYGLWRYASRHYGRKLDALAHLHAYLMCAMAKKRVPAYGKFLAEHDHLFQMFALEAFPETSKESYVISLLVRGSRT